MALGLGVAAYAQPIGDRIIEPPAFSDIAGHEAESELSLLGAMGVFAGDSVSAAS